MELLARAGTDPADGAQPSLHSTGAAAPGAGPCISVLGYPVSRLSLGQTVAQAWSLLRQRRPITIACANPHSLVTAATDPSFAKALKSADLLLPDGAGIVLAGRVMGQPFAELIG